MKTRNGSDDNRLVEDFGLRKDTPELLRVAKKEGRFPAENISSFFIRGVSNDREKISRAIEFLMQEFDRLDITVVTGDSEDCSKKEVTKPAPPTRVYDSLERVNMVAEVTIESNIEWDGTVSTYFRQMARYGPLSQERVCELSRMVLEDGNLDARNTIVLHNWRLAVAVAKKYLGRGVDFDDLIQEGNIGLMIAADRFDHSRGYMFSTYAYNWIKQRIGRYLQNNSRTIRIPVHLWELERKVVTAVDKLSLETGREPTPEEIGKEIGVEPKTVRKLLHTMELATTCSLDGEIDPNSGDSSTFHSQVSDERAVSAEFKIYAREKLQRCCTEVIILLSRLKAADLSDRQKSMFRRFYGLDSDFSKQTLEVTGEQFDVSRERIRQVVKLIWEALNEGGLILDQDGLLSDLRWIIELEKVVGVRLASIDHFAQLDITPDLIARVSSELVVIEPEEMPNEDPSAVEAAKANLQKTADTSIAVASRVSKLSTDAIRQKGRKAKVVNTRATIQWFLCKKLDFGFSEVGRLFDQDHSTVMHACDKVENKRETDLSTRRIIVSLTREILTNTTS